MYKYRKLLVFVCFKIYHFKDIIFIYFSHFVLFYLSLTFLALLESKYVLSQESKYVYAIGKFHCHRCIGLAIK